ncbi:MAG: hypothetical protein DHS20C15_16480 [Planctomycetota bacterium]|nr:MAG: hypothetical protein DHS20C15_16480 [Planctomycetota bacterium]
MVRGGAQNPRSPWLTWIVVCHQSARDLGVLLPSLQSELAALAARGCDSELIVVDNASTDGSAQVVTELAPGATLLRLDENIGYGAAINRAAGLAKGRWLAFGNADLCVPQGGLHELPRTLAAAADDVALIGPALFGSDGQPSLSAGRFPSLLSLLRGLRRPAHRRKYLRRREHRAGGVHWLTGACLFARADVFEAIKGFDEGFFLYYEDVDLAARLRSGGHRVVFEPSVKLIHVRPHHGRAPQPQIEALVRQSRLLYFRKHRPAFEAALLSALMRMEPLVRSRSRSRPALLPTASEPAESAPRGGVKPVSAPVHVGREAG